MKQRYRVPAAVGARRVDAPEFARAVQLGLGRAVLALLDGGAVPDRDALLRACLHDLTYDAQVESREQARYVVELVRLSDDVAWYRERILAALATTQDDDDLRHLFAVARVLAETGDEAARAAVYACFAEHAASAPADLGAHEIGADEIVQLDGARGLVFVAEHLGRRLGTDHQCWFDASLLNLAREKDGADAVDLAVASACAGDPLVAGYFDEVARVAAMPRARSPHEFAGLDHDALKARIEADPASLSRPALARWGKEADDTAIARAAADLSREAAPDRLAAYAALFAKRAFPLDPAPLVAAARSPHDKLARAAFDALRHLRGPAVRRLAVEAVAHPDRASMAIDLLALNYAPGDHHLVERALAAARDENDLHWVGYGALAVFEANPSPEASAALVTLYETGPCATCRERCFDLLARTGALPAWMLRESAYDANFDLREKARKLAAAQAELDPGR